MSSLQKILSTLDTLVAQRTEIAGAGWFLQHCWLVQVKPGGTARTDCKYWQVRSRRPILEGKTLKHLKRDEVEDYRTAIERGRQIEQIDRQINRLQKQLQQLGPAVNSFNEPLEPLSNPPTVLSTEDLQQPLERPPTSFQFKNLAEQELFVKELLSTTQTLRASLQGSAALNKRLRARILNRREIDPDRD